MGRLSKKGSSSSTKLNPKQLQEFIDANPDEKFQAYDFKTEKSKTFKIKDVSKVSVSKNGALILTSKNKLSTIVGVGSVNVPKGLLKVLKTKARGRSSSSERSSSSDEEKPKPRGRSRSRSQGPPGGRSQSTESKKGKRGLSVESKKGKRGRSKSTESRKSKRARSKSPNSDMTFESFLHGPRSKPRAKSSKSRSTSPSTSKTKTKSKSKSGNERIKGKELQRIIKANKGERVINRKTGAEIPFAQVDNVVKLANGAYYVGKKGWGGTFWAKDDLKGTK